MKAVLIATVLICASCGHHGETPTVTTKTIIHDITERGLAAYYAALGELPESLQALNVFMEAQGLDRVPPHDGWRRPLRYMLVSPSQVMVESLGADGELGGVGDNADITVLRDYA